ncbi:transposase [Streptomyces sp. NPDC005065]|uniref:transposase n=1 Tax=Streptomyces sp. NPDC005065 TaxID=3154461 RepID=UPI0033B36F42
MIDDSGDRKDSKATAHIGRQWLGRLGKTDNGIVTVTTCWADENLYYPLHSVPYSPAHHFPKGKSDPDFRTKLQIAAEPARTAKAAGVAFRAVAADGAYGDQDSFRRQLDKAGLPFVMALKPSHGTWAYGKDAYTPADAAALIGPARRLAPPEAFGQVFLRPRIPPTSGAKTVRSSQSFNRLATAPTIWIPAPRQPLLPIPQ